MPFVTTLALFVFLAVLAVLSLGAVVATVVQTVRDGYGRRPDWRRPTR